MVNYYVSQAGAGSKDGSSAANAWQGWDNIDWDTDGLGADTGVGAGDTLYVIGTLRKTVFDVDSYGLSELQRLTIASFPDDRGGLWSGVELDDSGWSGPDAFGAYSKTQTLSTSYTTAREWTSDPWDNTRLTRMTVVPDETWSGAGLFHNTGTVLYYKPTSGTPTGKTLTSSASTHQSVGLGMQDYVTFTGLRFFNAIIIQNGSDYFILEDFEITVDASQTAIEVGFPERTSSNYGIIRRGYVHDAGNGVYLINQSFGDEYNNNNWLVEYTYFENIRGTNDSHCIGIQGGEGNVFQYNNMYNGGSGITFWNQATQSMRNNIARFNRIDHMGYYYATDGSNGRGIEFSGETGDSDLTTGNLIYGNAISDCFWTTEGSAPDGIGIRIKNGIPSTGYSIQVFNNTADACRVSFYIKATNNESGEVGAWFKNNISLNPTSGGKHVVVQAITGDIDIVLDNNIYSPDGDFNYGGDIYNSLAAWQTASGQDANSYTTDPELDADYVPQGLTGNVYNGEVLTLGHDYILHSETVWPTAIVGDGNVQITRQGDNFEDWFIGAFSREFYFGEKTINGISIQ